MVNKISQATRCDHRPIVSLCLVGVLLAGSLFVALTSTVGANSSVTTSAITLLNQDFSQQTGIPGNIVLGNNLEYNVTATLNYDNADGAIEYKTTGNQMGSMYIGIEPFINGNISIDLRVNSNSFDSYVNIQASTFWIQAQTLSNGGARVVSYYQTSPTFYAYQSYDVPTSSLKNGVNTINIMISGTARNLMVYYDSNHQMTTPLSDWSVQKLPYCPITLPIIRLDNEKSGSDTWMSTLLYGIEETVDGGLVSAVPGNSFVPFGIDYPRDYANSLGTEYMSVHNQRGVAWADLGYLENEPQHILYIKSLLDDGWELGIHYNTPLNNLSIPEAQSLMREQYNQLTGIFGRSPTSWCSYQNEDNFTHAAFAYDQLGMIWRNGYSGDAYIANVGNLEETRWAGFWSDISAARMVYPSFTHQTDQTVAEDYSINYESFRKWVDNYDGKNIVGFHEYYNRLRNQIDTKINYIQYSEGTSLKFSVDCNQFPSRLIISFPIAGNAVVLKNGHTLVKNIDYSLIDTNHIALFSNSGDIFDIRSTNVPDAPTSLQATRSNAQVTLAWSAPSNNGGSSITNYRIYRSDNSEGEKLLTTLDNVMTYNDTFISNGHVYSYRVSAINRVGESALSKECSIALQNIPGAPTIISATPEGTQITLAWTAPDGGSDVIGYNIYRGTSPGAETFVATLGDALTYTDDSLASDMTYYYKVSAINRAGEGAASNEISASPSTVPLESRNSIVLTEGEMALLIIIIASILVIAGFIHLRRKMI